VIGDSCIFGCKERINTDKNIQTRPSMQESI